MFTHGWSGDGQRESKVAIHTGSKNKTIGTIVSDTYLDVCGLYVIVHGSI